jgi:hypothetical protein
VRVATPRRRQRITPPIERASNAKIGSTLIMTPKRSPERSEPQRRSRSGAKGPDPGASRRMVPFRAIGEAFIRVWSVARSRPQASEVPSRTSGGSRAFRSEAQATPTREARRESP